MGGIDRLVDINDPQPHNITDPTWEFEGIKGDGVKPPCVNTFSGNCIIVAGASNVYEDFEKAKILFNGNYTLLAVNDIGCYINEKVHAIITAHPEWAPGWLVWRKSHLGLYDLEVNEDKKQVNLPLIYSSIYHPSVDVFWSGLGNQVGTSGMLACLIAICMGFTKIILCGMPMDFTIPHFFSPYLIYQSPESQVINSKSWEYAVNQLPTFSKKIKSMSGFTKEWLGYPTTEWLAQEYIL